MTQIWVYLAASPLLWLTATLLCYLVALKIYRLSASHPLLNPVVIAVGLFGAGVMTGSLACPHAGRTTRPHAWVAGGAKGAPVWSVAYGA